MGRQVAQGRPQNGPEKPVIGKTPPGPVLKFLGPTLRTGLTFRIRPAMARHRPSFSGMLRDLAHDCSMHMASVVDCVRFRRAVYWLAETQTPIPGHVWGRETAGLVRVASLAGVEKKSVP